MLILYQLIIIYYIIISYENKLSFLYQLFLLINFDNKQKYKYQKWNQSNLYIYEINKNHMINKIVLSILILKIYIVYKIIDSYLIILISISIKHIILLIIIVIVIVIVKVKLNRNIIQLVMGYQHLNKTNKINE